MTRTKKRLRRFLFLLGRLDLNKQHASIKNRGKQRRANLSDQFVPDNDDDRGEQKVSLIASLHFPHLFAVRDGIVVRVKCSRSDGCLLLLLSSLLFDTIHLDRNEDEEGRRAADLELLSSIFLRQQNNQITGLFTSVSFDKDSAIETTTSDKSKNSKTSTRKREGEQHRS